MKLKLGDSMRRALSVLRQINISKKVERGLTVMVKNYANCREQGIALHLITVGPKRHHVKINFSECRGSDQMVVMWSKVEPYIHDDGSNVDEEDYKVRAVYIDGTDYKHAERKTAAFVVRLMNYIHEKGTSPLAKEVF